MWVFISSRLRQWVLFAVAVPILTSLIHLLRTRIEKKSGETALTKALAKIEDFGQRRPGQREVNRR